jgi:hypothetical protein
MRTGDEEVPSDDAKDDRVTARVVGGRIVGLVKVSACHR